jgi:hypothetical protein
VLKKSYKYSDEVLILQKKLNALDAPETTRLVEDGFFGKHTENAVIAYQKFKGLVVDGVVGVRTQEAIDSDLNIHSVRVNKLNRYLKERDLIEVANDLKVPLSVIKAISRVESSGVGFIDDKPKILFEGHQFWKALKRNGFKPQNHVEGNEEILFRRWSERPPYEGGLKEYDDLSKAKRIDKQSAIEATSWGRFQIMGFHWKKLGYVSAIEFEQLM